MRAAFTLSVMWRDARVFVSIIVLLYFLYSIGMIDILIKFIVVMEFRRVAKLPVEVKDLHYNFLQQKVFLTGLTVNAPPLEKDDRWDLENIVTIDQIEVDFPFWISLYFYATSATQLFVVDRITIRGLRVHVEGYRTLGEKGEKVEYNVSLFGKKPDIGAAVIIPVTADSAIATPVTPIFEDRPGELERSEGTAKVAHDEGEDHHLHAHKLSSNAALYAQDQHIAAQGGMTPVSGASNGSTSIKSDSAALTSRPAVPLTSQNKSQSSKISSSQQQQRQQELLQSGGGGESGKADKGEKSGKSGKSDKADKGGHGKSVDKSGKDSKGGDAPKPPARTYEAFFKQSFSSMQKKLVKLKDDAKTFNSQVKEKGFIQATKSKIKDVYTKTKRSIEDSINSRIASLHVKLRGEKPPPKPYGARLVCCSLRFEDIEIHMLRALPIQLRHLENKPLVVRSLTFKDVGYKGLVRSRAPANWRPYDEQWQQWWGWLQQQQMNDCGVVCEAVSSWTSDTLALLTTSFLRKSGAVGRGGSTVVTPNTTDSFDSHGAVGGADGDVHGRGGDGVVSDNDSEQVQAWEPTSCTSSMTTPSSTFTPEPRRALSADAAALITPRPQQRGGGEVARRIPAGPGSGHVCTPNPAAGFSSGFSSGAGSGLPRRSSPSPSSCSSLGPGCAVIDTPLQGKSRVYRTAADRQRVCETAMVDDGSEISIDDDYFSVESAMRRESRLSSGDSAVTEGGTPCSTTAALMRSVWKECRSVGNSPVPTHHEEVEGQEVRDSEERKNEEENNEESENGTEEESDLHLHHHNRARQLPQGIEIEIPEISTSVLKVSKTGESNVKADLACTGVNEVAVTDVNGDVSLCGSATDEVSIGMTVVSMPPHSSAAEHQASPAASLPGAISSVFIASEGALSATVPKAVQQGDSEDRHPVARSSLICPSSSHTGRVDPPVCSIDHPLQVQDRLDKIHCETRQMTHQGGSINTEISATSTIVPTATSSAGYGRTSDDRNAARMDTFPSYVGGSGRGGGGSIRQSAHLSTPDHADRITTRQSPGMNSLQQVPPPARGSVGTATVCAKASVNAVVQQGINTPTPAHSSATFVSNSLVMPVPTLLSPISPTFSSALSGDDPSGLCYNPEEMRSLEEDNCIVWKERRSKNHKTEQEDDAGRVEGKSREETAGGGRCSGVHSNVGRASSSRDGMRDGVRGGLAMVEEGDDESAALDERDKRVVIGLGEGGSGGGSGGGDGDRSSGGVRKSRGSSIHATPAGCQASEKTTTKSKKGKMGRVPRIAESVDIRSIHSFGSGVCVMQLRYKFERQMMQELFKGNAGR